METKIYATYLRVSTQKQGQTQLGLSSQRDMCERFIKEHNGELGKEFLDIESGTHRDRRGLWDAIEFCNKKHCPLVIATLSRLARDVEFCFKVINTGIEIHFVDMPTINTLLLGVFASVAQYERELTSDRTKKALAEKKRMGCKLGAQNEKWQKAYKAKSKEEKHEIGNKRGDTKNAHYLAKTETQAFLKILQRVFPDACKSENPKEWNWSMFNTKSANRDAIRNMMRDYRDMAGLFTKWNLDNTSTSDDVAFQRKLSCHLYNVKVAVMH